jgi:hypothetical protein
MYFPSIVYDNFFDDPDYIREYALSLDYPQSDPSYPGVRSKMLQEINPNLHSFIVNRLMGVFYDTREESQWRSYQWWCSMYFQKVDGNKYGEGWVHRDEAVKYTSIIYLNQKPNSNSGTSIFEAPDGTSLINTDAKEKYIKGEIDRETHDLKMYENNKQFEEVIKFKNKYNRLVAFEGNKYHAANEFQEIEDNEERLTLVIFLHNILVEKYPLQRSKLQG